jgi:tetratricopeptide (TPR) repeat protein
MGQDVRSKEEAKRAFELSGRLAREDQLAVEGAYYEVSADWAKAVEKYQALWNFFPDNIAYGLKLIYQLMIGGKLDEARRVLAQMRALPPPANSDPRINLVAALLAERLGNLSDALTEASGCADKATARKANNLVAAGRLQQGIAARRLGKPDAARRYLAEAKQIYERLGDPGGLADATHMDALVLIDRDQLDEAERLLNTAFEIVTRIGYQRLAGELRFARSRLAQRQGHLATARAEAEDGIASAREADVRSDTARGLNELGSVLRLQGEYGGARASFNEAARLARDIGEKALFTAAVNGLAGIDLAEGRVGDARQRLEEILPIDRPIGDPAALALRLANLSGALAMQGRPDAARRLVSEECAIHESRGASTALGACRLRLAALSIDEGRAVDARAMVEQVAAKLDATSLSPIDLARLATIHLSTGDRAKAASTIDAARRVLAIRAPTPEEAIAVAIAAARIDAASGRRGEAARLLNEARGDAERRGLLPLALEARLAMAEFGSGRAAAASVEADAQHAGLAVVANRAHALSAGGAMMRGADRAGASSSK